MSKSYKDGIDKDFEELTNAIKSLALKFPYGSKIGGNLFDLTNRVSRIKLAHDEVYESKCKEQVNETN